MRFDPAPLAWSQHKYRYHDRRNTSHCSGCGYDDSVKSHRHRHEDVRLHVVHSPPLNTSAICSIPVTSPRIRQMNQTAHSANQDRDCREPQLSLCPQPYGRALRTASSWTTNPLLARKDHLCIGITVHWTTARSRING